LRQQHRKAEKGKQAATSSAPVFKSVRSVCCSLEMSAKITLPVTRQ